MGINAGNLTMTGGGRNVGIGVDALTSNTDGRYSSAVGYQALYSNTGGDHNTAIGYQALYSNTGGSYNTAVGNYALYSNTSDSAFSNTAIGYQALYSNTYGRGNTAIGRDALYFNITGVYNTAIGKDALSSNTIGDRNIAIGNEAGYNIERTSGAITSFADAGGGQVTVTSAGHGLSNGTSVVIRGTTNYDTTYTISNVTADTFEITATWEGDDATGWWGIESEGKQNTILGYQAGYNNVTGSGNVFLGYQAGYNETGSNKLYIANSSTSSPLIYGDFSSGNVGIGTSTPASILHIDKSTATSTITIGGTHPVCLKLRDSDNAGWTYCTVLDGAMSCTSTPCE